MVNGEGDWGFYCRKDELDTLERWMTGAGFRVYGVMGGRGVGKTTLIKQAGRQLRGKKPFVYMELPAIGRKPLTSLIPEAN